MALHAVEIAWERPDLEGRSSSRWDCAEVARESVRDGVVTGVPVASVRTILLSHRLKPRRHRMRPSAEVPRDEAFAAAVHGPCALDTRRSRGDEMVLGADEHTDIRPRPRPWPAPASQPDRPTRVEQEYRRDGAPNLFAALDTRTGGVYAPAAGRRCQVEFIAFLEYLDGEIPGAVRRIHPVLDNYPTHTGKLVEEWLEERPRFRVFHPPVDRSWMNRVGRWLGILERKRKRIVDFAREDHLAERLMAFVREWDEPAHRFRWTKESFDRILEGGESVRGSAVA